MGPPGAVPPPTTIRDDPTSGNSRGLYLLIAALQADLGSFPVRVIANPAPAVEGDVTLGSRAGQRELMSLLRCFR